MLNHATVLIQTGDLKQIYYQIIINTYKHLAITYLSSLLESISICEGQTDVRLNADKQVEGSTRLIVGTFQSCTGALMITSMIFKRLSYCSLCAFAYICTRIKLPLFHWSMVSLYVSHLFIYEAFSICFKSHKLLCMRWSMPTSPCKDLNCVFSHCVLALASCEIVCFHVAISQVDDTESYPAAAVQLWC